ncbi:type VI secretion system baseplate subunit TssG [Rouxiella sp. WC2420]|uniref:Type VI secretion system baseplate subunit TssG n=1 Tax=Rouxiella sp. WC2420 TaxID=3234145 RepID=A0AB39VWV3_9GAMM
MSETLAAPAQWRVLGRLSEDFWQKLMASPYHYDLFQLLRRLDAQGGQRYLLGQAPHPHHEPVRIGQLPSLAFAPSTVASVKMRADSSLHDISIYSFGLFGPNGPLPLHMTEYAQQRVSHYADSSMTQFLDIFHHRLTLLFYRAWADAQPTVSLDREDNRRFNHYLASLTGRGLPAQQNRDSISEHAPFALAGHLTRQRRTPEGLEKVLAFYFNIKVKVVPNVPQWMHVGSKEQARLRAGRSMPRLGQSMFLGVAVRDIQHKFRIELGPLRLEEYQRFLPDQPFATQLRDWVRQYLGIEFAWELKLVLRKEDVSGVCIGGQQRLGYSSWLGQQPAPADRGELVFSLDL